MMMLMVGGIAVVSRSWWASQVSSPGSVGTASLSDAHAAFQQGDLARAIAITEQLLATNPRDTGALTLHVRARIYHSYTDFGQEKERLLAYQVTQQALGRSSTQVDTMAIHAFAAQANNYHDEAKRYALRAIERDQTHIVARLALALAYSSTGLFEAGLREADKAVALAEQYHPDWRWDAMRVRAIALSALGRWDAALTEIDRAIQHHKRLPAGYYEKALYALQVGNGDVATSAYFSVLALDAGNVKARYRLCELSSSMREYEAAIQYCTEVTERRPEWAEGWYQLGREYFLQGNLRAAQQSLQRCTSLQVSQNVPVAERRFECWYIQGQAAEILGDCAALVPLYNQYLSMERTARLPQSWVYPPEGPAICITPTPAHEARP
jgi:tetratricopeptide (TPR) repeat protein